LVTNLQAESKLSTYNCTKHVQNEFANLE